MNEKEYFEKVKSYKLIANKSLGQNFLVNSATAKKIVDMLELEDNDQVLEIGSGLGSLSYFLAKSPGNPTLIDIDERMLMFLEEQFKETSKVNIKRENILKGDLSNYNKIIGNLPYYITTSIIEKLLLEGTNCEKFVLMTQKEVYPKLLSNSISPLSLFLNHVATISSATEVGRNNFAPVPHVDSVVFVIKPNINIKNKDNKELYKLMKQLFLFRRKTILNNLTNLLKSKEKSREILEKMHIDLNKRPEQLSIEFYINLLKILKERVN